MLGVCAALAAGSAWAVYPNDVTFSGLDPASDQGVAPGAYKDVVIELGAAVAAKPMAPASTIGTSGFDVSMNHSVTFVDAAGADNIPSSWERLHESGSPDQAIWIPRIEARKGLPGSLEVTLELGVVGLSRQAVVGGHGRWALVEGYPRLPEVLIQAGYVGYTGNDELDLGVMDLSAGLGYSLPFGSVVGINTARFSPWLGATRLTVHAAPGLSEAEATALGLTPLSGFRNSDYYDPDLNFWQLQGGFHLRSGGVTFQLSACYAVGVAASVNAGLGLVF